MKICVIAVGQKLPAWAQVALDDYTKRFSPDWRVSIKSVKTPSRDGQSAAKLMALEAERMQAFFPKEPFIVALDERGANLTTQSLSEELKHWSAMGQDIVFLIGGPDGLDPELKVRAHQLLRLSSMTLPHAVVRVLLVEQLYRVWSIQNAHPYHRE
jgi:23S rRNA (pseudouridine1915-N3)-methyltransferase